MRKNICWLFGGILLTCVMGAAGGVGIFKLIQTDNIVVTEDITLRKNGEMCGSLSTTEDAVSLFLISPNGKNSLTFVVNSTTAKMVTGNPNKPSSLKAVKLGD